MCACDARLRSGADCIRSVHAAGSSEYRVNGRAVKVDKYQESLQAHNILVKARNFLVFQGDVEAVAQQSPKELAKLVEQISGSVRRPLMISAD